MNIHDEPTLGQRFADQIDRADAAYTRIEELQARVAELERALAYIADYEVPAWEPFATIEDLQDIAANATAGIYPWSHSTEREAR
jgi:hypothetical protein